jgi:hypothetical protein
MRSIKIEIQTLDKYVIRTRLKRIAIFIAATEKYKLTRPRVKKLRGIKKE